MTSWAVEIAQKATQDFFRKKEENEAALDAGLPLPHPDIPVFSKEQRIDWTRFRLTFDR